MIPSGNFKMSAWTSEFTNATWTLLLLTLSLTDIKVAFNLLAILINFYLDLNNPQEKAAWCLKHLVITIKVLNMMMEVSSLLAASQEYSRRTKRPSRGWRHWVLRNVRRSLAMRWCWPCSSTRLSASQSRPSQPSCISFTTLRSIKNIFLNTLLSSFLGWYD